MLLSLEMTFWCLQELPRYFFPTGCSDVGQVLHLALNGFELESLDIYLTYEQHKVKSGKTN